MHKPFKTNRVPRRDCRGEYRIFAGTICPIAGKGPYIELSSTYDAPGATKEQKYHDKAAMISEYDFAMLESTMVGLPVYYYHSDPSDPMTENFGEITGVVLTDDKTGIYAEIKIYVDTERGQRLANAINRGLLRGLSIDYSLGRPRGRLVGAKIFNSLSITPTGSQFYENCLIDEMKCSKTVRGVFNFLNIGTGTN